MGYGKYSVKEETELTLPGSSIISELNWPGFFSH